MKADQKNAVSAPDAPAGRVFNPTLPDAVRITELMYETEGPSETLPQWIELYNASQTPVDLKDWQLAVETRTDATHQHAHPHAKVHITATETDGDFGDPDGAKTRIHCRPKRFMISLKHTERCSVRNT